MSLMLTRVRHVLAGSALADAAGATAAQLRESDVRVKKGARIAIAVGSRGIVDLCVIVREVVAWVRAQGGEPFLVPAMGSHGGATAEGQVRVLAGYGITEEEVGAPVRSSLDVVELPRGEATVPVYLDGYAAAADGIIVINRIKPHTSFHGRYESGLMKMLAIGLGKHKQALAIHGGGIAALREQMPLVAAQILRHAPVILGLGIVENARDETLAIRAIPASRIPDEEPVLLELARKNMPRLPVEELDLLIVDEIGKNISGLGMDTNVIGRLRIPGQPEPESPRIRIIYVRDLTPETAGNAAGIGLADLVSRKAYEKIDLAGTYANVLTTGFLERGRIPIVVDSDLKAVEICAGLPGMPPLERMKIMCIRNTLQLEWLRVSRPLLSEVAGRQGVEILGPEAPAFAEMPPQSEDNAAGRRP